MVALAHPRHTPAEDATSSFPGSTGVKGTYLDEVLMMRNAAGTKYYYHTNHLYSVHAITNSAGAIVEAVGSYDAYGKPTILTGAGTDATWFTTDDVTASVSAIGNPFWFHGNRVDAETELGYWRYRFYSFNFGRYIARDPLGGWSHQSQYSYDGIDPYGLGEAEGAPRPSPPVPYSPKPSPNVPVEVVPIDPSKIKAPPPKAGRAPIGVDGYPIEVHHEEQKPAGVAKEMTRTEHRLGENYSENHPNTGQQRSPIDRTAFRAFVRRHWAQRFGESSQGCGVPGGPTAVVVIMCFSIYERITQGPPLPPPPLPPAPIKLHYSWYHYFPLIGKWWRGPLVRFSGKSHKNYVQCIEYAREEGIPVSPADE